VAVTYASFIDAYPEFATLTQTRIERELDRAIAQLDEDQIGEAFYDEAVELLTAHKMALGNQAAAQGGTGGITGGVRSVSVQGEGSITYSDVGTNQRRFQAGDYGLTVYGVRLQALLSKVVLGVMVV